MDTDFIEKAYKAFNDAPVVYIAWTILVGSAVGALAWFVRRSVDGGTIEALRERLELRRETVERVTLDLGKATAEIKSLREALREASPSAQAIRFLDSLESHTASASSGMSDVRIFTSIPSTPGSGLLGQSVGAARSEKKG